MSSGDELQAFIVAKLRDSAEVGAICADRIYDNIPKDAAFPYISFGASDYRPDDAECIDGRVETVQLDCWSRDFGKLIETKRLVDAVKKALHGQTGDLGASALVQMRVSLVRVFRDPDGISAHGVVQVECDIEEG